jgi:transposase-like protein
MKTSNVLDILVQSRLDAKAAKRFPARLSDGPHVRRCDCLSGPGCMVGNVAAGGCDE